MIPGSNNDHPSFRKSFLFAIRGFRTAVRTERNIKVMIGGGIGAIVAGFVVGLTPELGDRARVLWGGHLGGASQHRRRDCGRPGVAEFHPLAGRAAGHCGGGSVGAPVLVALVGIIVFANAIFF